MSYRTCMPTGPLIVGCCDIMIGRSKDGILMRLFYPANSNKLPSNPSQWTSWFLGPEYGYGIGNFVAPAYLKSATGWLFNWQTRHAVVPSIWCGDLLKSSTKLPVIVFSHGLSGNRSMYSSVCCQLASHGFVVAALEHRDGSSSNTFTLTQSGEEVSVPFEVIPNGVKEHPLRSKQIEIRVAESCRTLTLLEELNAGVHQESDLKTDFKLSQLVNKLDLTRPIMAGHSFGGCTTVGALAKDKRFKLGIALDPWLFPIKDKADSICPAVDQPLLCISTEAFQTKQNLGVMSKLPEKNTSFVTIKGTVHQNQSDMPFLMSWYGRYASGCRSDLDYVVAMEVNNALMLAYIHSHQGLPESLSGSQWGDKWRKFVESKKEKLLVESLYGSGKKMLGYDGWVHP